MADTVENTRWVRILELTDRLCHKAFDPYVNAKPLGHHLPGWGLIQLWQWYLCNTYERAAWPDGDWIGDPNLSSEQKLARFETLDPQSTRGPLTEEFPNDDNDADEYEFHRCPHEVIRATCGPGGCTCPCDPCAPSRVTPPGATDA